MEEQKKKSLDWPEAKPFSELDNTDMAMLRMMEPASKKHDCDCGICNFCNGGRPPTTWIKVSDGYPEPELPVIAFVQRAFGNPHNTRRIRAMWIPAFTSPADDNDEYESGEYDEATDEYYIREGWYEQNEFEEIHWKVSGEVTHWMNLPGPPREDDENSKPNENVTSNG